MRDSYELRSPLGKIEDNSTKYIFTDWTSAVKLRNYINPLLRIDVGVLRLLTEDRDEIEGYQITVYDVSTQVIVYKFYVNYIKDYVYSFTTAEAIDFLNHIGFNCYYEEPIVITDTAREILEACLSLGYTHIKRVLNTSEFILTTGASVSEAEIITGNLLSEVLANKYDKPNLYDFRFIGRVPVSIEELLK